MSKKGIRHFDEQISSGSSDSVLASLYRSILHNLLNAAQFEERVTRYVIRHFKSASNIKDRSSIRSQLYKELLSDRITFKVFMKGLRVIGVKGFDLRISLHHANGNTTVHEKKVIMDVDDNEQ